MLSFNNYLTEARFKSLGEDEDQDGWKFKVTWGFDDQLGSGFQTVRDEKIKTLERAGAKFKKSFMRSSNEFIMRASSERDAKKKIKRALGSALGL